MVRVVRAARCAVHDQGGRILLNFIVYIYIVSIPKLYIFILLVFSIFISTISDNNIGRWLPFPPYPLPNVVLQVQKNIERKVDIIVATLKEGKRGRAFV